MGAWERAARWWGVAVVLTVLLLPPDAAGRGPRRPDLVVARVADPPGRALPGGRFAARDVTVNVGDHRAAASHTGFALGVRGGHAVRAVAALRKGARSSGEVEVAIPARMPDGEYRLVACADAWRQVRERVEDNNCRSSAGVLVIDTTPPPAPRIDGHPAAVTAESNVTFSFSSGEVGVRFSCRVDDAAWTPCASPQEVADLAEGEHRFAVSARDAAGNHSPPAVFEWVVDRTPPSVPSIDERPAPVMAGGDARFAFSSAETGAGFECALDGDPPSGCTSPTVLSGLVDGPHVFRVLARDAAGNESAAAVATWTVVPVQMTLGDGAWSWFADPRAVHYQGAHRRTYVGWVARDGDIKVSAYDHDTLARTAALLASAIEIDDHANPALQILPDGRVRAYYSAHGGARMWYRTSLAPEDASAWAPAVALPQNSGGTRGFTYPNPVHLAAEERTYLFWRGGDYNPTFATQADGSDAWTPVRSLVSVPGQRPYVKYDSDGQTTIHIGFTNAHPAEADDVNIYYAAYRAGELRRADGTPIGPLGTPIRPSDADLVYDAPYNAWIHDVAHDAQGRPVLVFAAFPSRTDHRYFYARFTGERWVTHEITAAGGSISEDPREPYYSGGITLDHEDPRVVYLSRAVGGAYEVESWQTPDGGATWTSAAVTAGSDTKNVRPVSPRGMLPFSGDMSVLWMRGRYPYYLSYQTSITTILRTGGNTPPVADASASQATGLAPQAIDFDGRPSRDPDGALTAYRWDFGDGTQGTGAQVQHTYQQGGHYFPALTVVDDDGAADTYVTEVMIDAARPPSVATGPALELASGAATLHGTVTPQKQPTTFHFEFGITGLDAHTPEQTLTDGGLTAIDVDAELTGLTAGQVYRYRLVATNATGTTAGPERTFTADAPPGPGDYRSVVLGTPGLVGYWRLGETSGRTAADERGANPGTYSAAGVTLGQPGALRGDPNPAAAFDGTVGEMSAGTPALSTSGTLEGWFHWQAGVAIMRDNNASPGTGWILAYDSGGQIACRAGGTNLISSTPVSSIRDGWHHFALTRSANDVRLYIDGRRIELPATAPGSADSTAPWHVMRNGNATSQYTRGRADEIAVYSLPLTATDIRQHAALGP